MNKFYFFRDLDHEANLDDGRTYHAAGYVDKLFCELGNPNSSGKDVSVVFMDPFTGFECRQWRAINDVELFEVSKFDYQQLIDKLNE